MGVVRSDVSPEFAVTTLSSANHGLSFDPCLLFLIRLAGVPVVLTCRVYYDVSTDGHFFIEFVERCDYNAGGNLVKSLF